MKVNQSSEAASTSTVTTLWTRSSWSLLLQRHTWWRRPPCSWAPSSSTPSPPDPSSSPTRVLTCCNGRRPTYPSSPPPSSPSPSPRACSTLVRASAWRWSMHQKRTASIRLFWPSALPCYKEVVRSRMSLSSFTVRDFHWPRLSRSTPSK